MTRRLAARLRQASRSTDHAWLRVAIVLLAALGLAACGAEAPAASAGHPAATGRMVPTMAKTPSSATSASPDDPRSMGDPQAPIRVIEYSDFQCPFCARFASDTAAQIQAAYIDTGKVYFQYRDFPLVDIHPGALLAAHAANCAAEQGAFWPMHDQLFQGAAAQAWGSGDTAAPSASNASRWRDNWARCSWVTSRPRLASQSPSMWAFSEAASKRCGSYIIR